MRELLVELLGLEDPWPTAKDIEEFERADEDLTDEDRAMLKKMGENLPSQIKEWEAAKRGNLVVHDERQGQVDSGDPGCREDNGVHRPREQSAGPRQG